MIPANIIADELLISALISGWRLEVMSTNLVGYWIFQLTKQDDDSLAILINFDHLAAFCNGMRACIDATDDSSQYPRATGMFQTVAVDLPTQKNGDGGISLVSDWKEVPHLTISYYRARKIPGAVIRQTVSIKDARALYDFFAKIYNDFPNKQDWNE